MNQLNLTSLVINSSYAKQLGIPPSYYRWRSCNPNFPDRTQTSVGGFTPADQYQKLKLIQNTARVYGSLYTANLGPLTAYTKPPVGTIVSTSSGGKQLIGGTGVCWNQMSDRPVPSVQRASIPTGYATAMNRRHTSVTSSKPGCQTPGGAGCDIKHNSYDRYLNRLKGKGPMRRGVIPPKFGTPLPFNPAVPVYGGKTTKTNIVSGCDCPIESPAQNKQTDIQIYNNPLYTSYPISTYGFKVGDYVYAKKTGEQNYSKALVINVVNDIYTIEFEDGTIQTVTDVNELLIYFPCNCNTSTNSTVSFAATQFIDAAAIYGAECKFPVSAFLTV